MKEGEAFKPKSEDYLVAENMLSNKQQDESEERERGFEWADFKPTDIIWDNFNEHIFGDVGSLESLNEVLEQVRHELALHEDMAREIIAKHFQLLPGFPRTIPKGIINNLGVAIDGKRRYKLGAAYSGIKTKAGELLMPAPKWAFTQAREFVLEAVKKCDIEHQKSWKDEDIVYDCQDKFNNLSTIFDFSVSTDEAYFRYGAGKGIDFSSVDQEDNPYSHLPGPGRLRAELLFNIDRVIENPNNPEFLWRLELLIHFGNIEIPTDAEE